MKSLTKELWVNVPQRRQIVDIHGEVEQCVRDSGVQEGLCLVNPKATAQHTPDHQSG